MAWLPNKMRSELLPTVLIVGVNPFEDVPGYQLLGLMKDRFPHLLLADDSRIAIEILSSLGVRIHHLPRPAQAPDAFVSRLLQLCSDEAVDLVLPGTDATLSAIAQCLTDSDDLYRLCPWAGTIQSLGLFNKERIQDWIGDFAATPKRWSCEGAGGLNAHTCRDLWPVMVKGMRKGALKSEDDPSLHYAYRSVLDNPANEGPHGGCYLEEFIDGEEYSTLLLLNEGEVLTRIDIRKMATTPLGTTLVAEVVNGRDIRWGLDELPYMPGPVVIEIESRRTSQGDFFVFEANLRFPTWISCLGPFGRQCVDNYVSLLLTGSAPFVTEQRPRPGTVIFRLPESGALPLPEVVAEFRNSDAADESVPRPDSSQVPLWAGRSPHQFLVK